MVTPFPVTWGVEIPLRGLYPLFFFYLVTFVLTIGTFSRYVGT